MVVVAIDTSHSAGSAALARDGVVVSRATFGEGGSHLVELGRTVDGLLSGVGLGAGDIDRVAFVIGPGSFTGLRIGLSWVKGLHAALGVDVVTMGTLELLALPLLAETASVCAMVDARRDEIYGACFSQPTMRDGVAIGAAASIAPVAQAPAAFVERLDAAVEVFVGTGVARYRSLLDGFAGARFVDAPGDALPSTAHLAAIAGHLGALPHDRVRTLEPSNLRGSAARKRKLRPIEP
jgi:tRNA threonylcarbamoyladenosine biosynthesis protein TsaB